MDAEQLFGTRDLYEILNIDRAAPIAEGKTIYFHCFSLILIDFRGFDFALL